VELQRSHDNTTCKTAGARTFKSHENACLRLVTIRIRVVRRNRAAGGPGQVHSLRLHSSQSGQSRCLTSSVNDVVVYSFVETMFMFMVQVHLLIKYEGSDGLIRGQKAFTVNGGLRLVSGEDAAGKETLLSRGP
jgi:hypothetical protein